MLPNIKEKNTLNKSRSSLLELVRLETPKGKTIFFLSIKVLE